MNGVEYYHRGNDSSHTTHNVTDAESANYRQLDDPFERYTHHIDKERGIGDSNILDGVSSRSGPVLPPRRHSKEGLREENRHIYTNRLPHRCGPTSSHSLEGMTDDEAFNYYYGPNGNGRERYMHNRFPKKKMTTNKSHGTSSNPDDTGSQASMDSTGKKKSFRRLFTRFAEKTSLNGVPYIHNARYWWAKLIWCLCLLCAVAVMVLHLWYLFDQYYQWPKQTKIALGFDALSFPEVTICNTNVLHKGRLDKFRGAEELKELLEALKPENIAPEQFDENYDPYESTTAATVTTNQAGTAAPGTAPPTSPPPPANNGRRKRFVESYDNLNLSQFDQDRAEVDDDPDSDEFAGAVDPQTTINNLFKELYIDIEKNRRANLGHNIEDMLLSCTFNGRECDSRMFKLHQTEEYGNCWSLSSKMFKVKTSGPSGGLSLIFYLQVTEYILGITTGYGARLQIHEQGTYPFPDQEGLFIPASMETDIGLKLIAIERLGGNYGTCDDGSQFLSQYNITYSRRACQAICKIQAVIDACNCFDNGAEEFATRGNETIRPCRSEKELKCMRRIQKQFENIENACTCNNPCNEVQYRRSVSQRQWPTDDYAMVLLQSVCDKDKAACRLLRKNIDNINSINNNFLKLNIYYEDLNFENMTETPEIEIQQFLSDVGGAIGLWIGLSILSLFEVIQLIVELCDYGVHKTVREGRQERKKRRKLRQRQEMDARKQQDRNGGGDNNPAYSQWPHTHFDSNTRGEGDISKNGGLYWTPYMDRRVDRDVDYSPHNSPRNSPRNRYSDDHAEHRYP